MPPMSRTSLPEQAAEHLRESIQQGRWSDRLPGVSLLAAELDVARHTIRRALQLLEAEGLVGGRGLGRSRCIAAAGGSAALRRSLRVAILRHDKDLGDNPQTSMVLTQIMHSLKTAGHEVSFCKKSQLELRNDVGRIARHLATIAADAWVVESGSYPLLEWCATRPTPCLALYGRTGDKPLARTGPDTAPALRSATRHLVALGHRRIVLITRTSHRKPTPGRSERAFLEELASHGVVSGDYNLPDWKETPEGFHQLLSNLFKSTPPTALIIDEIPHFFAAVAFCARHGIRVPEQVSLVSTDCDAMLDWCHPGFAHLRWDNALIVRRVVRWVNDVRIGKPDRKTINVPAEFVPGGSTGPANVAS